MTQFDTIAVVDWSGGNDTGPKPRKDAIWLGAVRKGETEKPLYLRNRVVAETALVALIDQEQAAGRRVLARVDAPTPARMERATLTTHLVIARATRSGDMSETSRFLYGRAICQEGAITRRVD